VRRPIPRPLAPKKADKRTDYCGAQLSLRRQCQLCDPEADVRISELEWPLWVDSSPSWLSHNRTLLRCRRRATFGQNRSFTETTLNVRLRIRKQSLGQQTSHFRSRPVLCGQDRDHRGAVGAECGEGLELGLYPRAAASVGTGDRQPVGDQILPPRWSARAPYTDAREFAVRP